MIDADELNKKVVTIEGYKDQFLAVWYAVKRNIQEEIPEPSDIGFLLEIMGDLAEQVKDTNKPQKIKLPLQKWIGCWHCLNVCLNNKLFTNIAQEGIMCEIMSIMAVRMDAAQTEELPPELDQKPAIVGYDPSGLQKAKEMAEEGELAPVVSIGKQGFKLIDGGKE